MIDMMMILQVLTADKALNLIFAALCLWGGSGRGARWCAVVGAVVYVLLALV